MSAFGISLGSAPITKYISVAAPDSVAAAAALHLFGDTAALSKRNYAGAQADATIIGTPLYGKGYATINSGTAGFEDSAVLGNSPFSHIAVVRKGAIFVNMGNAVAGTIRNLIETNGTNTVGLAVDSSYRATGASAASGFQFIGVKHDGATASIYIGSGGVLTKTTGAYAGGAGSTVAFRIGACGAGTTAFDAASAGTFPGVTLSDAEMLEWYLYMQDLLSTRSITVQ